MAVPPLPPLPTMPSVLDGPSPPPPAAAAAAGNEATQAIARELGIDPNALTRFQNEVHLWVELDATIQRLRAALKERRAAKVMLQERIMRFMAQSEVNNVSVNSGNVRLRYRVAYTRAPLSHQVIRDRITAYLGNNPTVAQTLLNVAFARERVERPCLRKLGPPRAPPGELALTSATGGDASSAP